MKTTLSSKGQIVLPAAVRRKLGLETGATLEVGTEADHIVLKPIRPRTRVPKIAVSRVTGLPVLHVGENSPGITGEQVSELLSEFP